MDVPRLHPESRGSGVVYGLFVPNAPNLIAPQAFGGLGEEAVSSLRYLDLTREVRPEVIVVSTPHFESPGPFQVQASPRPRCLHDFGGMPEILQRIQYEPPGDPPLARALVAEGERRGLSVQATEDWGLDHGAWAPLLHFAPRADVPVVPISIAPVSEERHMAWGEAISAALRTQGKRAAFIGTGSITHRLDRVTMGTTSTWEEGARIEEEIVQEVLTGDPRRLLRFDRRKWRTVAPEGNLGPLFTLLGALGPGYRGRLVSTGQVFGAAGLSILEFLPGPRPG